MEHKRTSESQFGRRVNKNLAVYQTIDYAHNMNKLPIPLELTSGVHVETMVGQMLGTQQVQHMLQMILDQ